MPIPSPAVDHASALPPEVVRALRLVAAELRSMPRDCARDREELVFWHSRLARRLDALVVSKAHAAPAKAPPATVGAVGASAPADAARPPRPAPPKRRAEAPATETRPLPARTTPATHWRARPADAAFRRRAEEAGQLRFTE